MNKFADWMKKNHQMQLGVSQELGISQPLLHNILKKNHTPTLKVAYAIELYTRGAITLYDWVDHVDGQSQITKKTKTQIKGIKTNK